MNRTLKFIFIFIIIISVGSFREVIFVNLNNQISFINGEIPQSGLVSYLSFISNFSISTLVILKWVFTIAYMLFFLFLGRYVISNFFNSKEFASWYTGVYILFFLLSGLFFLVGYFSGSTENMYSLARAVMGALQSPIPLLIISPLLLVKKHL